MRAWGSLGEPAHTCSAAGVAWATHGAGGRRGGEALVGRQACGRPSPSLASSSVPRGSLASRGVEGEGEDGAQLLERDVDVGLGGLVRVDGQHEVVQADKGGLRGEGRGEERGEERKN